MKPNQQMTPNQQTTPNEQTTCGDEFKPGDGQTWEEYSLAAAGISSRSALSYEQASEAIPRRLAAIIQLGRELAAIKKRGKSERI